MKVILNSNVSVDNIGDGKALCFHWKYFLLRLGAIMSLQQNFQTIKSEHGFKPCHVQGVIPKSLNGTLYRNGPGLFERYGVSYGHCFGGHGVINAVRFKDGDA